jgi:hypothetical protein
MIYRDQLEEVYALIEDPKRWTQGAYARTEDGEFIGDDCEGESYIESATAPEAACWCVLGAGLKCGISEGSMGIALGNDYANAFNDNHTHGEVLALLKSAIERAPVRP